MTNSSVEVILQARCETEQAYQEILAGVQAEGRFEVEILTPFEAQDDHRCELGVLVPDATVLAEELGVLEQVCLSAEGVVPETVRATIRHPQEHPFVIGQYVDFLESKIDHLMVRTLNLQEQLDGPIKDTLAACSSLNDAAGKCHGLYAGLQQQGVQFHSAMIQHIASAIEAQTGVNPLADFTATLTIH